MWPRYLDREAFSSFKSTAVQHLSIPNVDRDKGQTELLGGDRNYRCSPCTYTTECHKINNVIAEPLLLCIADIALLFDAEKKKE